MALSLPLSFSPSLPIQPGSKLLFLCLRFSRMKCCAWPLKLFMTEGKLLQLKTENKDVSVVDQNWVYMKYITKLVETEIICKSTIFCQEQKIQLFLSILLQCGVAFSLVVSFSSFVSKAMIFHLFLIPPFVGLFFVLYQNHKLCFLFICFIGAFKTYLLESFPPLLSPI